MKKLIGIVLIIGLAGFWGCDNSTEPDELSDQEKIQNLYNSVVTYYNNENISGLISLYSELYKHNGLVKGDLDTLWNSRVGDGSITITSIEVQATINDTLAQCVLDIYTVDSSRTDTTHFEPGDEGDANDVCFLRNEGGDWKFYGNQADAPLPPLPPADALVGTWQSTSIVVYHGSSIANADSSEVIPSEEFSEVLTFNADGTCIMILTNIEGSTTSNWTYTATDTEITLTFTGEGEVGAWVLTYELSGDTLTTTQHFEAIIDDQHDEPEGWIVTTLTMQ